MEPNSIGIIYNKNGVKRSGNADLGGSPQSDTYGNLGNFSKISKAGGAYD